MIMVTHDVALKNYANKIVKMFDGKVNKIEEVPKDIRKTTIDNLNEKVRLILEGKDTGQLNVREGVEDGVGNAPN